MTPQHSSIENRQPLLLSLAALIFIQCALFYQSYWSMVQIWWRSETFAHGFLIFPIALYLIWQKRQTLVHTPQQADIRALPLLLALALLWLLAHRVEVAVVEQYAIVAMLPVLVWLMLGWRIVHLLAFPLLFLFFAVPMGEFLIYPMMEFTATFTVNAVRMTGIPVFRDGMFFSLPSGRWSVVEGCSGVRYIIASVTLGTLYAYLTYRGIWRRMAFMLLAITFPVIANGLRAYIIVMIAHLSDMKLATGVDHLIYGWVWFGIVMLIMFWIGSFWRDDDQDEQVTPAAVSAIKPRVNWYAAMVPALLLLLLGPVWSGWISARAGGDSYTLQRPQATTAWQEVEPVTQWWPRYINPTAELMQSYTNGNDQVGLYLAYYGPAVEGETPPGELINSQNVLVVQKHPEWRLPTQQGRMITVKGKAYPIIESRLMSSNQQLLVWHWQRVAGKDTISPLEAKIQEAFAELSGAQRDGFGIVLFTPLLTDLDAGRARLQRFLDSELAAIDQALAR